MAEYLPDTNTDKSAPQPGEAGFFGTQATSGPTAIRYNEQGERVTYTQPSNYNAANAWGLIQNLKSIPGGVDALKEDLYWAGYYGSESPRIGGDIFDRNDEQVLMAVMDKAAANGFSDPLVLLQQEAMQGQARLAPLGTELADEDNPALQLAALAQNNGVKLSDDYIASVVGAIGAGTTTLDAETARIREKIIAQAFPAWADEIKAGANVADIAAPYKQAMSQILEVPEDAIDLNDRALKKALQGVDANGKPGYTPLWKFQDDLKEDPRWQYTNNAYETMNSAVTGLMNTMGL